MHINEIVVWRYPDNWCKTSIRNLWNHCEITDYHCKDYSEPSFQPKTVQNSWTSRMMIRMIPKSPCEHTESVIIPPWSGELHAFGGEHLTAFLVKRLALPHSVSCILVRKTQKPRTYQLWVWISGKSTSRTHLRTGCGASDVLSQIL